MNLYCLNHYHQTELKNNYSIS